jgi:hypothetical protein
MKTEDEAKSLARGFWLAIQHQFCERGTSILAGVCKSGIKIDTLKGRELSDRMAFMHTVHRDGGPLNKRLRHSNILERYAIAYYDYVKSIASNANLIWALEILANPDSELGIMELSKTDFGKNMNDDKLAALGLKCAIGGEAYPLLKVKRTFFLTIKYPDGEEQNGDVKYSECKILVHGDNSGLLYQFHWACHVQEKLREMVDLEGKHPPKKGKIEKGATPTEIEAINDAFKQAIAKFVTELCKEPSQHFAELWIKIKTRFNEMLPEASRKAVEESIQHDWRVATGNPPQQQQQQH